MTSHPVIRNLLANPFRTVIGLAIAFVITKAVIDGADLLTDYGGMGNDDIMRLLTVRDWIAGQGWYDVVQYRLLPPEGVSVHWSRYIDVGIAAIILPISAFVPMDTAEMLAAAIWPTLILILTILVIGFGARRVFGPLPAIFAVLCVTFWPLTADLHASPGNLDHHNIQLLMMVLLAFAVIWPSRPLAAGTVGGIAAAFSLAIGLESLPFIVGAGLALLVRALFMPTPVAQKVLLAFCAILGAASVLLFIGQTPPGQWTTPVCDELGTPVLSLIAIAITACTAPFAAGRWLKTPLLKLGAIIILTGIGIMVAWPHLSECQDGPYGDLPLVLQEAISSRITEAKPGLVYAQSHLGTALVLALPVLVSLLCGGYLWLLSGRGESARTHSDQALGLLLILCLLGTVMMFLQMRTVIMVASVVPMIGGVVIAYLLQGYLQERDLTKGLAAIAVATMITSPMSVIMPLLPWLEQDQKATREERANCSAYASLRTLNEVPPGRVLTHINFGPALIWATHHAGLSAPYHRSSAALANGILPFALAGPEMAAYVRDAGATHLLLCRGYNYDSDFADDLASGGSADWLRRVPVSDDAQLLFAVLPE